MHPVAHLARVQHCVHCALTACCLCLSHVRPVLSLSGVTLVRLFHFAGVAHQFRVPSVIPLGPPLPHDYVGFFERCATPTRAKLRGRFHGVCLQRQSRGLHPHSQASHPSHRLRLASGWWATSQREIATGRPPRTKTCRHPLSFSINLSRRRRCCRPLPPRATARFSAKIKHRKIHREDHLPPELFKLLPVLAAADFHAVRLKAIMFCYQPSTWRRRRLPQAQVQRRQVRTNIPSCSLPSQERPTEAFSEKPSSRR